MCRGAEAIVTPSDSFEAEPVEEDRRRGSDGEVVVSVGPEDRLEQLVGPVDDRIREPVPRPEDEEMRIAPLAQLRAELVET